MLKLVFLNHANPTMATVMAARAAIGLISAITTVMSALKGAIAIKAAQISTNATASFYLLKAFKPFV